MAETKGEFFDIVLTNGCAYHFLQDINRQEDAGTKMDNVTAPQGAGYCPAMKKKEINMVELRRITEDNFIDAFNLK